MIPLIPQEEVASKVSAEEWEELIQMTFSKCFSEAEEEWVEILSPVEAWKIISFPNSQEGQDEVVEVKWEEWAECHLHLWEDFQAQGEEEVVVEQVEIHSLSSVYECNK